MAISNPTIERQFENSREWRAAIREVLANDADNMREIPIEEQVFIGEPDGEDGIGAELVPVLVAANECNDQYTDSGIVGALNDFISIIETSGTPEQEGISLLSRQRYLKTFMEAVVRREVNDDRLRHFIRSVFQRAADKRGEFAHVMTMVLDELEAEGKIPKRRPMVSDVI